MKSIRMYCPNVIVFVKYAFPFEISHPPPAEDRAAVSRVPWLEGYASPLATG